MSRAMLGALLLVDLVVASSGCSRREEPPPASDPVPKITTVFEEADPPDGPDLEKLRGDVRRVLPELRQHIDAGRRKGRDPTTGDGLCMSDFTTRLGRAHEIEKVIGPATRWVDWAAPQFQVASALSNTLIPLRGCINCVPADTRECTTAGAAFQKLEALVGRGDAGAVASAGPPARLAKPAAPATASNVPRLRQCCSALGTEGARMGNDPEAGKLSEAAAQCSALAIAAGPGGSVPENGVLRDRLAGRTIPAVCGGF